MGHRDRNVCFDVVLGNLIIKCRIASVVIPAYLYPIRPPVSVLR